MNLRRALIVACVLLMLFLGVYSWNRRSHVLDDAATNVGLELARLVLEPMARAKSAVIEIWDRYFDLVDVREENLRLKARLAELQAQLLATGEDLAELRRLRSLVEFPVDVRWRPLAARVLAGRIGPNAVLDSITISRGYVNGALPGVPLVTNLGLVGRVLRSSAHASTVLLITDPDSRVAVFGQETRAPGILKGRGMGKPLEVDFVQRDVAMKDGEVLVTSGLDNKFPKGLPVARVTGVSPSDYTQFMAVQAAPLVDLQHLEEVLLLEKSGVEVPDEEPETEFVGPPLPPDHVSVQPQSQAPRQPPRPETSAPAQRGAEPVQASPTAQPRQTAPRTPAPGDRVPLNREGAPMYRVIVP